MEQFQISNGQGIRVLNSGQNIQIIQSSGNENATLRQATLNGQPVLLQIVQQRPDDNQVVLTTKPETPKKRPLEHVTTQQLTPIQAPLVLDSNRPNSSMNQSWCSRGAVEVHSIGNGSYEAGPAAKRARLARGGLRICAKDVCDKVREKGRTTYFEVANEIVGDSLGTGDVDEKNLKRRVYDALNVLMALNIVHKERNKEKTISWVGLPTTTNQGDRSHLQTEKQTLARRVKHKEAVLKELLLQHVAFKRLIDRNRKSQENSSTPKSVVQLPFIVVNMMRDTQIDCSISEDQFEYHLKFTREFELHDELEILKRLGLADPTNAETLLPPKLRHYLRASTLPTSSRVTIASSGVSVSTTMTSESSQNNSTNEQIELVELSDLVKAETSRISFE